MALPDRNCPYGLWSLWDIMRSVHVSGLLYLVDLAAGWERAKLNVAIPESSRTSVIAKFPGYRAELLSLGLLGTASTMEKIVAVMDRPGCQWSDLNDLAKEFSGRLVDETKHAQFFSMTVGEGQWFANPRRGWELSIERFPTCLDDVEEASKCFALSRYPAAVFHSVQVVEIGLIELGTFLKVSDPVSGWTAVCKALKRVIDKKHQERTAFEKKNFAFLEQMEGLVQGLKNAWRNKISHAHGRLTLISKEFSPDVAEEILFATRAFMRRLADDLPPAKQTTKKRHASKGRPS